MPAEVAEVKVQTPNPTVNTVSINEIPEIILRYSLTPENARNFYLLVQETKKCGIFIDGRKTGGRKVMVKPLGDIRKGAVIWVETPAIGRQICRIAGGEPVFEGNMNLMRGFTKNIGIVEERYLEQFMPKTPVTLSTERRAEARREHLRKLIQASVV